MFRLLRVIIRPSNELIQNYLISKLCSELSVVAVFDIIQSFVIFFVANTVPVGKC